jgi:hypothetical protein
LMHDIHGQSVEMTKKMIPILKAEGFSFVKVTDVPAIRSKLSIGEPVEQGCYSTSLSRNVTSGTCVKTATSKWFVCESGGWDAVASGGNAACKSIAR